MKKLAIEDFIARAKQVHGDKYDYSKVLYKNSETKVCIICPEHGEFWQYPLNHLKGYGCKFCGYKVTTNKQKLTTETFIEKARKVHGDKYDYSKVVYGKNNMEKVCIICPIHGEFWMSPSKHLQGQNCPQCVMGGKLTTEEFIEKARKVHGDKYDYSKVDYIDSRIKVCIICPIHGEFKITPHAHISGRGCQECGYERRRNAKRMSQEKFIEKARQIHGDKYDYFKVDYKNNYTKICIKCNKCGYEFMQRPRTHLSGVGCPHCKFSKLEIEVENALKELRISYESQKRLDNQFLDFYLPEYNIAIECQGKQHFSGKDFFGVDKNDRETHFLINIQRDIRKHNKCKEKGIKLLYYVNSLHLPSDYLSNSLFQGIYNKSNVFTDLSELLNNIQFISKEISS